MRVRLVPAGELQDILCEPWVDRSRRPHVAGGIAWVPVRDGYPADDILPEPERYRGRGYHMIGDVAVLHGPQPSEVEVEEIVAYKHPRGVIHISGYRGEMRVPDVEVLYGTAGEVKHREQGYTYLLDPSRVMFAQGNRQEKARMAALAGIGERVADMFAGIGYFTIPVACAGAEVHAMELNPIAFEYLTRNIIENRVDDRVEAALGDSRTLLSGHYNRIIMGHFDAPSMLGAALDHARAGTVLHVHSIGDAAETIRACVKEAGFTAEITARRVKKYGPHAWHLVQDVTLS